mmetsp:Transcript_2059/g.3223  ORF Transcript_2059/g.3223 Transcript_2059/m.3223 type:complete len:183 (-) Transcript_2059:1781-2329(-)
MKRVSSWPSISSASTDRSYPLTASSRKEFNFFPFLVNSNEFFPVAMEELSSTGKDSHWIWFIFPQLALLGHSYNAQYFGIKSLPEAQKYLSDAILGHRLVDISQVALSRLHGGMSIRTLMGSPVDAFKLLSSSTLFFYASLDTDHNFLFETLMNECIKQLGRNDSRTVKFCEESLVALKAST